MSPGSRVRLYEHLTLQELIGKMTVRGEAGLLQPSPAAFHHVFLLVAGNLILKKMGKLWFLRKISLS